MDQNQIPSSPRHRPSSSTGPPPKQNQPSELPTDKLALPSSSTSHPLSSPVTTTQLPPWQGVEEQPYPTPSTSTYPAWSDEPAQPNPAWTQETYHTCLNTQDQCRSPPLVDLPLPSQSSASTALLTSEPLNRASSSAHPSPVPSPSPFMRHSILSSLPSSPSVASRAQKRPRSNSLPTGIPILKRQKNRHTHLTTPSEPRSWTIYKSKDHTKTSDLWGFTDPRSRSRSSFATRQARETDITAKEVEQFLVASHIPPTNIQTLKSLDAAEILRIPQLRHDLLFDALAFKPVSYNSNPSRISQSANYDENQVQRDIEIGTNIAIAEMYWESIAEEIRVGCRCVRWKVRAVNGHVGSDAVEARQREGSCECGRWQEHLPESEWRKSQKRKWPSRIPSMVKTLREILVSLMGATVPSSDPTSSRRGLSPNSMCQQANTHSIIPELYAALDPDFLTAQVRRNVFNLSIFELLGDAMKIHCAPVRDDMVDDMVETALKGHVAEALRKSFDCVEVMKLDIANHQIHGLRPHLWKTAAHDERTAFSHLLLRMHTTIQTSQTQQWIAQASNRVLIATSPSERVELKNDRNRLVCKSVVEGFVDLVFKYHVSQSSMVPESLKLDRKRIKNFNKDIQSLATRYVLLRSIRTLITAIHPNMIESEISEVLRQTKADIDDHLDSTFHSNFGDQPSDLAHSLASRIVLVPCGRREECTMALDDEPRQYSKDDLERIDRIACALDHLLQQYLDPASKPIKGVLEPLREIISKLFGNSIVRSKASITSLPNSALPTPPITPSAKREEEQRQVLLILEEEQSLLARNGFSEFDEDIRDLVGRMHRVVDFHLSAFSEMYAMQGMVIGRGTNPLSTM